MFAADIKTNEEILLYDGCKHGYNAMLCDLFTPEQISNRTPTLFYIDNSGEDIFEIIVSVYCNIDYNDEIADFQDENGNIRLIPDEIISADTLRRNGFAVLKITVINSRGQASIIVEEELAWKRRRPDLINGFS